MRGARFKLSIIAAALAALVTSAPAQAEPVRFEGASADGDHVFFNTEEALVDQDTDDAIDLYERSAGQFRLVAVGPLEPSGVRAEINLVTRDGSRVLFTAKTSLVETDTNREPDCYERSAETTVLLPRSACGGRLSFDGSRLYFATGSSLSPIDTDTSFDIYELDGSDASLLTPNTAESPQNFRVADDGSRIFIQTREALDPADADTNQDIYEVVAGSYALGSEGSVGQCEVERGCDSFLLATSLNGERVIFATPERLSADDVDSADDLYVRDPSATTLIDNGSAGRIAGSPMISEDATRVLFQTKGRLVRDDRDEGRDIYLWNQGTVTLVGGRKAGRLEDASNLRDASPALDHIVFGTEAGLLEDDRRSDLYEWNADGLRIVTDRRRASWDYQEISRNGQRIYFTSRQRYLRTDNDRDEDIYERRNGQLVLVSGGRGANGPSDAARLLAVAADRDLAYFTSRQRLTARDHDDETDVYVREGPRLNVVSAGDDRTASRRIYGTIGTPPGGRGLVAFTSNCRDGCGSGAVGGIFDVQSNGSGTRRLLDDETAAGPVFSPDGRWIAFQGDLEGDQEIYLIRPNGSGLHKITSNEADDRNPGWLPDGRVSFLSDIDGDPDFYALSLRDGAIQNIGETLGDASLDGRRVAVTRCPRRRDCDIYLYSRSGKLLRSLTRSPAEDGDAEFSPDGRSIAFISNRGVGKRPTYEIYLMNSDGSDQRRLTVPHPGTDHSQPTYSPDGRSILFVEYSYFIVKDLATGRRTFIPREGSVGDLEDPDWQALRPGSGK